MALFKISKGTAANLVTNRPYAAEGNAYFTTDDGKFYIDIDGDGTTAANIGTNRIPLSAAQADRLKYSLTISLLSNTYSYNGSSAVDFTITPASIGALAASATAVNSKLLDHYYDSIPLSANVTDQTTGTALQFFVDSTTTTGKPDGSGHILHFFGKTAFGSSQLFLSTGSDPFMQIRGMDEYGYGDWKTVATTDGTIAMAEAVAHSFTITLNSGTTEDTNKFTFDGSADKNLNLSPAAISALALAGGTMTGSIVLPTRSSRINTDGSILWKNTNDAIISQIGSNGEGLGIATSSDIRFTPNKGETTSLGLLIGRNSNDSSYYFRPYGDGVIADLGSNSKKWRNVYATNFYGNATSAMSLVSVGNQNKLYAPPQNQFAYSTITAEDVGTGTGSFSTTGDDNAMLTFDRYAGNGGYFSQLAFSSDGKLYYRAFSNLAMNETSPWREIAFTGSTIDIATRVSHKLVIGSYEYDGSSRVEIPIYNGSTT